MHARLDQVACIVLMVKIMVVIMMATFMMMMRAMVKLIQSCFSPTLSPTPTVQRITLSLLHTNTSFRSPSAALRVIMVLMMMVMVKNTWPFLVVEVGKERRKVFSW